MGDGTSPEETPRLFAQLHLTHAGEPTTYAEAQGDPAWHTAMKQELESVEKNRTWELVDLPTGHRPISLKWVFKLKKDEKGAVIKHKARLVARGFILQEGIDYDDTFALVARMESVRVLLALAAQEGWWLHHVDMKSAFLNGDLKEEVYVRQPPGFAIAREEGKVYRLRNCLGGGGARQLGRRGGGAWRRGWRRAWPFNARTMGIEYNKNRRMITVHHGKVVNRHGRESQTPVCIA